MKVLVLGGGASGMIAALTAAEDPSNRVTLLERQSRVGRKLLATGNGRCNLTNLHADVSHYHGSDPTFTSPALRYFPVEDTLAYFRKLGLVTVAEPDGKVYPFSDQANSVVDVLRLALVRSGVDVRCGCEVIQISKKARGYSLKTQEESFFADKVILACGGPAGGKLGGTDLGYKLLSAMGHTFLAPKPALVQIRTDTTYTKSLKGVRADAGVILKRGNSVAATNSGEIQFTDFGISGPTIFGLSREVSSADNQTLLLDLFRPMTQEETRSMLLARRDGDPERLLEDFLTGMLHNRLGRVVLTAAGYRLDARCGDLSDADMDRIVQKIKYFPLPVTGVMGLDQAQVTAGGIRTEEFRADTLESRLCPGLFATGELLDIDGDCGGYNLQWAWSSGRLAGRLGNTGE
jgi:predicted Rossmann fold flavoprotein